MEEIDIESKGYHIALTNKENGNQFTCSLSNDREKWIVEGTGYKGYFSTLESAYLEACRHLRFKDEHPNNKAEDEY